MRKLLLGIVAAIALMLGSAAPASAITGNFVEDHEHPFVGLIVFYDEEGEFTSRCSGSLITPTVFLTAGHCTADNASARVYFQQDAGADYDPAARDGPRGLGRLCRSGTGWLALVLDAQRHDGLLFCVGNGRYPGGTYWRMRIP